MLLAPHTYCFLIEGQKIAESTLYPDCFLAIDSTITNGNDLRNKSITGIDTKEPAFGLKAKWIDSTQKEIAENNGYTVINAISVLITHLSETLKRNAYQILSRDDVHFLMQLTKKRTPKLVENIVPEMFSLAEIQQILQNLLQEKVSILNFSRILEVLTTYGSQTKDLAQLTELARQNLASSICEAYQTETGILAVITLAPETENSLRQAIIPDETGPAVTLSPDYLQKFIDSIKNIKAQATIADGEAVLLVSADIRRALKELIFHTLPDIAVLSFQEVIDVPEIKCIGMVQIT